MSLQLDYDTFVGLSFGFFVACAGVRLTHGLFGFLSGWRQRFQRRRVDLA